jgi:hypothetical protein
VLPYSYGGDRVCNDTSTNNTFNHSYSYRPEAGLNRFHDQ